MASLATNLRKRRKAPLTSDSKACPAKRSMTQPSRLTQYQLSMNPATTATTSGSVDTSASFSADKNKTCTTGLCDVCKQLTSTTTIGTDSLKCSSCGLIYHGE